MPEFRFSNGVLLARAVEVLLPLAKEGIINYSPEGLSLVVSEPSGLLKAALEIKSSGFTIFDCDVKSSASVNLEELYKELNRSTGEDALTIFGGDGDYIRFQYHSTIFMTVKKSQVTFEVEGEETNLSTLTKQYRITSQIAEDDFLCLIFSLDHMRSLQNASRLSRYVCIFSSDTFNCMLNYRIGEGIAINFYFL